MSLLIFLGIVLFNVVAGCVEEVQLAKKRREIEERRKKGYRW